MTKRLCHQSGMASDTDDATNTQTLHNVTLWSIAGYQRGQLLKRILKSSRRVNGGTELLHGSGYSVMGVQYPQRVTGALNEHELM